LAGGCRGWLVAAAVAAGHLLVALFSACLWRCVLGLPFFVVWPLVPVSVCGVAAVLAAVAEAVRLVGGVDSFFCGGRGALLDLLGFARAEPPRRLVRSGVFAVARHPAYSGSLAAYAAAVLSLPWLLPGLPLVAVWVYAAARGEERVDSRSPEYRRYMGEVPGLAPLRVLAYGARRCLGMLGMLAGSRSRGGLR